MHERPSGNLHIAFPHSVCKAASLPDSNHLPCNTSTLDGISTKDTATELQNKASYVEHTTNAEFNTQSDSHKSNENDLIVPLTDHRENSSSFLYHDSQHVQITKKQIPYVPTVKLLSRLEQKLSDQADIPSLPCSLNLLDLTPKHTSISKDLCDLIVCHLRGDLNGRQFSDDESASGSSSDPEDAEPYSPTQDCVSIDSPIVYSPRVYSPRVYSPIVYSPTQSSDMLVQRTPLVSGFHESGLSHAGIYSPTQSVDMLVQRTPLVSGFHESGPSHAGIYSPTQGFDVDNHGEYSPTLFIPCFGVDVSDSSDSDVVIIEEECTPRIGEVQVARVSERRDSDMDLDSSQDSTPSLPYSPNSCLDQSVNVPEIQVDVAPELKQGERIKERASSEDLTYSSLHYSPSSPSTIASDIEWCKRPCSSKPGYRSSGLRHCDKHKNSQVPSFRSLCPSDTSTSALAAKCFQSRTCSSQSSYLRSHFGSKQSQKSTKDSTPSYSPSSPSSVESESHCDSSVRGYGLAPLVGSELDHSTSVWSPLSLIELSPYGAEYFKLQVADEFNYSTPSWSPLSSTETEASPESDYMKWKLSDSESGVSQDSVVDWTFKGCSDDSSDSDVVIIEEECTPRIGNSFSYPIVLSDEECRPQSVHDSKIATGTLSQKESPLVDSIPSERNGIVQGTASKYMCEFTRRISSIFFNANCGNMLHGQVTYNGIEPCTSHSIDLINIENSLEINPSSSFLERMEPIATPLATTQGSTIIFCDSHVSNQEKLIASCKECKLSDIPLPGEIQGATSKSPQETLVGSEAENKFTDISVSDEYQVTTYKSPQEKLVGCDQEDKVTDISASDEYQATTYKSPQEKLVGCDQEDKDTDISASDEYQTATSRSPQEKLVGSDQEDKVTDISVSDEYQATSSKSPQEKLVGSDQEDKVTDISASEEYQATASKSPQEKLVGSDQEDKVTDISASDGYQTAASKSPQENLVGSDQEDKVTDISVSDEYQTASSKSPQEKLVGSDQEEKDTDISASDGYQTATSKSPQEKLLGSNLEDKVTDISVSDEYQMISSESHQEKLFGSDQENKVTEIPVSDGYQTTTSKSPQEKLVGFDQDDIHSPDEYQATSSSKLGQVNLPLVGSDHQDKVTDILVPVEYHGRPSSKSPQDNLVGSDVEEKLNELPVLDESQATFSSKSQEDLVGWEEDKFTEMPVPDEYHGTTFSESPQERLVNCTPEKHQFSGDAKESTSSVDPERDYCTPSQSLLSVKQPELYHDCGDYLK
jgi:hypothetical protein